MNMIPICAGARYRSLAMIAAFSAATLVAAASASSAPAQEWTRFRGPNGSGLSSAKKIPTQWSKSDYRWDVELPGIGHSSPVVWQNKVFLTSADLAAGKRYLLGLDARSGKQLWQREFPFAKHRKHKQNSFATNTPTVDARHVYAVWQAPNQSEVVAVKHDGQIAWRYGLGKFKAGHGSAVSPILFEDTVIVCNDHQGKEPFLAALRCDTGEEVWKVPRASMRPCYATPCVFRPSGRPAELIFSHSYLGITSHDPRTGEQNWEILPFGEFKQRACASPITAGDLVIGTSGFATAEKNVVAVRPRYDGARPQVSEVYRVSKATPHVPTPLVAGDRMYLWTDRGIVSSVEVAGGKRIWQKRVGGNYFGSPVWIDGRLFAIDTDGVVVVIAAADDFQVLARNPLGESSCSTPAVANETLYLRTESRLFAIGGK